jgi:membrane-bound serine protease (ClpP class)
MIEEILLNPNVAYLILVASALAAILAVLNPGTGVLEVAALFLLILSGYTIFNLPVNYWALGLLVVGVVPFLLALRRSQNMVFLVLSIGALVFGSIFLFSVNGWQPAVNPFLAALVSLSVGGFVWLIAQKALEADRRRPSHDLDALIGSIGEAKTEINDEGSVQVGGELWSARSDQAIPLGARVRVIAREGFILKVEPL